MRKAKRGYLWVTLMFFLISLGGLWVFSWFHYVDEQQAHGEPIEVSQYVIETSQSVLENWQSEFLSLMWQVAGLAALLYVGSPQSKEGDDRKEEKLDLILRKLDPDRADVAIAKLDQKYPRK